MIQTNAAVAVATANDRGKGGGRVSRFTTSSAFRRQSFFPYLTMVFDGLHDAFGFRINEYPGWWMLKVRRAISLYEKYASRTKSMLRWVFLHDGFVGHGMSSNLRLTTSRRQSAWCALLYSLVHHMRNKLHIEPWARWNPAFFLGSTSSFF